VIQLDELNHLPAEQFVEALSGVFERSPWVAQRAAGQRPFATGLDLHEALCAAVDEARSEEQLELIRAHPELASRAAIHGLLTPESNREQQGAGLTACSPEEYARLQALNREYREKHGFPFVLAVKGHTRASIIATLAQRLTNSTEAEQRVALAEIARIALFRLTAKLEEPSGPLIMAMAERLARFSDQENALTCTYLTPAHQATAAQLRDWMLAADLAVTTDAVGNVIGRWHSEHDGAPTMLTGSHFDTVINAGKFDGRLGILLPIAVIASLRRVDAQLPYSVAVIAFAEEEGARFKSTFLGSRALAGSFDPAALEAVDATGIKLKDAMRAAGLDPEGIPQAALDPAQLFGFVEVHIEQGPVLLSEALPLGVVTSIAGSTRYQVTITGSAGHAGTVPMALRRDAAAAAAEVVLAVEKRCREAAGLVGTVGQLEVPDGAVNVIPGFARLSIDIRAAEDTTRDAAVHDVTAECGHIATLRNVEMRWRKVLEIDSVPCSEWLQQLLAESISHVTADAVRYLPSGAGHDAMVMAAVTPAAMLFVRSGRGGISHHPDESVSVEDVELAARAFADFLMNLPPPS
jgi:beta-ureidopropionase / N-carbamoyl-L-amino-acid hydrolase